MHFGCRGQSSQFSVGLVQAVLAGQGGSSSAGQAPPISQLEATMAAGNASVSFRQEPNGTISGMAEPRPRRGHGEDSIYFDQANNHWVGAVSLGYKAGKRVRKTVIGRANEILTHARRG
jgi:hypothetical protein